MARKRSELGTKADTLIKRGVERGGTAESIARELRAQGLRGVSERTVGRRLRELRGARQAGRVKRKSVAETSTAVEIPPLPASPEAIPEGANLETLQRWLGMADQGGQQALARSDLATMGAMGRLVASLCEAIRKGTPAETPDPNDQPDMIAAAARARELLHHAVDKALGAVDKALE